MRSEAEALERVQQTLEYLDAQECFTSSLKTGDLQPISVILDPSSPNNCTTVHEITVARNHVNGSDSLHGGAVATIFDLCSSMNIVAVSREGFWDTGHVSRTLNCTYLRPAPLGERLVVECETVHVGKTMALIKGVIKRKRDGAVCYTCEHNKVKVGQPQL